jgi:ceramide glucosyltransferase
VVATAVPDYSLGEFLKHQLRWARTVKDRRPAQYLGLVVTYALPWAILAVILSPLRWWTWLVLALCACCRFAAALAVSRRVTQDATAVRNLWLLPLRDFFALVVWFASFFGNTVEWRGLRFKLRKGKLQRA